MLSLKKDANALVVQDIPVGYWLGALFFLTFGVILAVQGTLLPSQLSIRAILPCVVTLWFFGIAAWLGRWGMIETTVNRNLHTLTITSTGILGRRYRRFTFTDVEGGAILREFHTRRGDPESVGYSIQLLMKDGTAIDLMSREGRKEGPIFEAVDSINEYLGMQITGDDYRPKTFSDVTDELS